MARDFLPQSRVRVKRRRRRLIIAGSIIGILLVIFGGLVWLSWAPFLRINTVTVSGAQTLATSTIAGLATKKLSGAYWGLFARDNIFLYSKSSLAASLISAMPTIASADVHAENFTAIAVTVTERQPKALWCGESTATAAPCFFLDQGGVAYAGADSSGSLANSYQKYYGVLSGSASPKHFLTPEQFGSLSALVDALAQQQGGNTIQSIAVASNGDVTVTFANGFDLLFNLSSDGGDIYQRFMLALTSDPFKQNPLASFEYLDLRFGDKLYYKLKTQ